LKKELNWQCGRLPAKPSVAKANFLLIQWLTLYCRRRGLVWALLPCGTRVDWSSFSSWHSPARVFFRRLTDTALEVLALRQQIGGSGPQLDIAWCVGLSWPCCGDSVPSRPNVRHCESRHHRRAFRAFPPV